ncbi:PKD domain-containing protein [Humibacillus sp. DSM 29435]|uniref:PKD domain-containing protein n=1 Tax=Humibacillus sp. DSM 29435 TaxID=1869167 RepID=UPI001113204E|nr:PKD domain-containing protein [Humibacillus sp. DSM 29435]
MEPIFIDYVKCTPAGKSDPQPLQGDPVWKGHKGGAIYDCIVGPRVVNQVFVAGYTIFFWSKTGPKAPPPPDPRDLAQDAVATMDLQPITIGVVPLPKPGSIGLVGLPNYMWVREPTPGTYGPITRTASAGGYTVTATARVARVVWDMGDGPSITCGKGTPYESRFGKQKSPTCGHVYTRQGRYPVTATSYWVIDWAGIGQAGTITLDLTQNATLTIGEAQVISQ